MSVTGGHYSALGMTVPARLVEIALAERDAPVTQQMLREECEARGHHEVEIQCYGQALPDVVCGRCGVAVRTAPYSDTP